MKKFIITTIGLALVVYYVLPYLIDGIVIDGGRAAIIAALLFAVAIGRVPLAALAYTAFLFLGQLNRAPGKIMPLLGALRVNVTFLPTTVVVLAASEAEMMFRIIPGFI